MSTEKRVNIGMIGAGWWSHFLHLAEWFYGEVEAVSAQLSALVKRPPNPQGQSYEQADDTAMVMLRFKNGAQGLVHASAIAYERT